MKNMFRFTRILEERLSDQKTKNIIYWMIFGEENIHKKMSDDHLNFATNNNEQATIKTQNIKPQIL